MKRIVFARAALAVLNLALVAALLLAAKLVFFTRSDPHLPTLAVKALAVDAKPPEPLSQYEVVWKELDRPPPPKPAEPAPPLAPRADELLRVAFVAVDPARPGDRLCIVQRVGAAEQLILRAGETESGWTCAAIEQDEGDWVVEVRSASGSAGRLRVRRDDERPR